MQQDSRSPSFGPKAKSAGFEFRIRGRVAPAKLARFEGLRSSVEPVETILHGPVRDQAQLHGVLELVRALGLELIEVRRLPD